MAFGYLMFQAIDWAMILGGNATPTSELFDCQNEVYVVVACSDSNGAIFLFAQSIILFLFSLLIWYIFYRIPDSFGLLKKRQTKDLIMHKTNSLRATQIKDT